MLLQLYEDVSEQPLVCSNEPSINELVMDAAERASYRTELPLLYSSSPVCVSCRRAVETYSCMRHYLKVSFKASLLLVPTRARPA